MQKLIYQVKLGNSKLYDTCCKSVRDYANKIGATYIRQTEPILNIKPDPGNTNRSLECQMREVPLPIFEKENAFDYRDRFDQICVIDADVYIRPNAEYDIFEDFGTEHAFGAVVEREMPITQIYMDKIKNYSRMQYGQWPDLFPIDFATGSEFMNMGVMIFNSKLLDSYLGTESAKEFLGRSDFKKFVDGVGPFKWSTDQTLLNWWIKDTGMSYKKMHWKYNGLYTANTKINECQFVHFFLKDKLPNRGENVDQLLKDIMS